MPSKILKELDPDTYHCYFMNYINGLELTETEEYKELEEKIEELENEIEELEEELKNKIKNMKKEIEILKNEGNPANKEEELIKLENLIASV